MSRPRFEPEFMPWNFWGSEDIGFPTNPLFFVVPVRGTTKISSLGWWDGDEIVWLMEKYNTANDVVFYTLDGVKDMDECSKQEWFEYVSEKTPQCLDWILFRLEDLTLL
jgi:hypothetical protein